MSKRERRTPTCATCKYMAVEWRNDPRTRLGWCYCRHKQAAEYQARMLPGSIRQPGFICKTLPDGRTPALQQPTWCPRRGPRVTGYSRREFMALPLAERRAKIETLKDPFAREVMMAAFGHFGKRSWVQVALAIGGGNTPEGVRTIVKRALKKLPRKVEPVFSSDHDRL